MVYLPKKRKTILNIKTGRYVFIDGKIGQEILNQKKGGSTIKIDSCSINIDNKNEYKIECGKNGLRQFHANTCWFHSILNALLLGEHSFKILAKKFFGLPYKLQKSIKEDVDLLVDGQASCSNSLKRYQIYKYVYLMLNDYKIYDPENSVKVMNQSITNLDLPITRYTTNDALPKVLSSFLHKDEYIIVDDIKEKFEIKPSTLFIYYTINKSSSVNLTPNNFKLGDIPIMTNNFVLNSVAFSLIFSINDDIKGHAFCGFQCSGKFYIYDSQSYETFELDWRKKENIENHYINILKSPDFLNFKFINLEYKNVCFTRKT